MNNIVGESKKLIDFNNNSDSGFSAKSIRVITIRYKVYLLLLIFAFYFFIQYLFFPALDNYQNKNIQLQNRIDEINNFETERLKLLSDILLIDSIQENESLILSCINDNVACDNLDNNILQNINLVKNFMNLNYSIESVMVVDEKSILASINDFMLLGPNNRKNGIVESINISDPIHHKGNIKKVSISLNVKFDNKDSLLQFLENIENKISENFMNRQLYFIEKVDYDVVNFDQIQNANISLSMFYFVL